MLKPAPGIVIQHKLYRNGSTVCTLAGMACHMAERQLAGASKLIEQILPRGFGTLIGYPGRGGVSIS